MARRVHLWCFIAVLAWAPLPLASNRPWSWSLLALCTGLLLVGWAVIAARDPDAPGVALRRVAVPATLWSAALAWGMLQTLPGVLPALAHPLWRDAAAALDMSLAGRIALDPEAAAGGLLRLVTYGGIFWLALQHGRSSRAAARLVTALALVAIACAAYGLVVHLLGIERVLWYAKSAYRGDLTATFVNRNSFACYAGIGLLAAIATLTVRAGAAARDEGPRFDPGDRRIGGCLAGMGVLALALVATGSRGGAAATLLGLGVMTVLLVRRRAWRIGGGAVLLLAVPVLVALFFASTEALDRVRVYDTTLAALAQRPLAGVGLGGFAGAFAMLRPDSVTQYWTAAHSVYLELALELGLPAAAAFCGALLWLTARCAGAALRRRRDGVYPGVAAAAAVLAAAHGVIDLAPQIPAVAATLAALLGLGVAQSWSSAEGRRLA